MDVLILINNSIGLVRPAVGFGKKAVAQLRPKIVGDLNNAQLNYKDLWPEKVDDILHKGERKLSVQLKWQFSHQSLDGLAFTAKKKENK